jgi:hypothetical protein
VQVSLVAKLPPEEVELWKCPKAERTVCWWYEIAREIVQDDISNKGERLDDFVCDLRHEVGIKDFDSVATSRLPFRGLLALDMLLLYEEWPKTPYLAIPQAERTQRLNSYPKLTPSVSVKASLIVGNYSSGEQPKVEIQIPKWATHKQLRESFAAYLKVYFPNQPRAREQGRPSSKLATLEDNICALIAYRLCKREGMARHESLKHIRNAKGEQVYASGKALDKPLKRAKKRIGQFRKIFLEELDLYRMYLEKKAEHEEKSRILETETARLQAELARLTKG